MPEEGLQILPLAIDWLSLQKFLTDTSEIADQDLSWNPGRGVH